jgi:hypothetical protein
MPRDDECEPAIKIFPGAIYIKPFNVLCPLLKDFKILDIHLHGLA